MSSIKCPNCNLTNFSTAQFCKRCNLELNQNPANRVQNETQLFNPANNTHLRQVPPVQPNQPVNNGGYYQNNQPNYQQGNGGQNYRQPFQNNQNYQQPYQAQQYRQPAYQQPPPNDWSMPQFPKGQRPPQYNGYQQPQQNPGFYRTGEMAFRRLGKEIVLHQNSTLPEVCVRCGRNLATYNEGAYVAQKMKWHHPAVYAALISPLIYVILAACLSERFTIEVPLCSAHLEKRENLKTALIVGGIIWAVFLVIVFNAGYFGFGFLTFIVGFILIILNFEYGYKPLRVKKIEGSYYHLGGASQEFLNTLPY